MNEERMKVVDQTESPVIAMIIGSLGTWRGRAIQNSRLRYSRRARSADLSDEVAHATR